MTANKIRVGIQQRVLPYYRGDFFDLLSEDSRYAFSVFAGEGLPSETLGKGAELKKTQHYKAQNLHMGQGGTYSCIQWNIFSWLKKWDPQVLVVEANPRYLHLRFVIDWMHKHGRKVLGWGLGAPPTTAHNQRVKARWLSRLDGLITYSQQGKQEYASLGIPAEKIFVAPNAVAFRPRQAYQPRPELSVHSGLTVLFVGRLQERKRVDQLIEACGALPVNLQPNLVIIGKGLEEDELKELAAKKYPQTQFLGGLFGNSLDYWFERANLFVLPGTGGLAIQQAMSHGLPIIAAEADGTQRDLVRPTNGWVLENGELSTLVRALETALSDPGKLDEMGKESYQIVQEEVNLENMAAQFIEAIDETLKAAK